MPEEEARRGSVSSSGTSVPDVVYRLRKLLFLLAHPAVLFGHGLAVLLLTECLSLGLLRDDVHLPTPLPPSHNCQPLYDADVRSDGRNGEVHPAP